MDDNPETLAKAVSIAKKSNNAGFLAYAYSELCRSTGQTRYCVANLKKGQRRLDPALD